jgi:hypothetical protein
VDGFARVLSVISSSLMRGMPKAFETISATVVGSLSFLSFEVFQSNFVSMLVGSLKFWSEIPNN